MKLTELNPRWCAAGRQDGRGMGMSFDCPVHLEHRLVVMFANPLDGLPACTAAKWLWKRTGDTFDNITLVPSVDASSNVVLETPCWHGFIKNGEIC